MIKSGVPFCNYCEKELVALTEEEALADITSHGWTNWRTASVHCCFECSDKMWKPPCGECETHPCERGRDCWASPPLHLFPYETYYADRLGEEPYAFEIDDTDDESEETESKDAKEKQLDLAVRRRQLMKLAGRHPHQKRLLEVEA
ncbi:MAG: hypothetical protein ACQCN4_11315 [Candidatus Bathyarchaeia archaeon]|jgi:hypothetical protein